MLEKPQKWTFPKLEVSLSLFIFPLEILKTVISHIYFIKLKLSSQVLIRIEEEGQNTLIMG